MALPENHALICNPVYVGRFADLAAISSDGIEGLLVGHDKQDVWSHRFLAARAQHKHKK